MTREHTPRPGVTWELFAAATEQLVDGDDWDTELRPANRAARRAAKRNGLTPAVSRVQGEHTINNEQRETAMARSNHDGTWTLTQAEYQELKDDSDKLAALENAGVDNWEGYSQAMSELYDDEE